MIQDKHQRDEWRDLTGPEKLRLFAKINIPKFSMTITMTIQLIFN